MPEPTSPVQTQKRSLRDLYAARHFNIHSLAHLARVNEAIVYTMLADQPVQRHEAEAVLNGLTVMRVTETQQHNYTLENVTVALRPDE